MTLSDEERKVSKAKKKAKAKERSQRPENKEKAKERSQLPENIAKRKEYERNYAQSPQRKEYERKRAQEPKRIAAAKKRAQSPEGKLRRKKYDASPAKKEYNKKRDKTPERRKYKKQLGKDIKFTTFSVYSKRHSNSDIPCCRCCGENSDMRFLAMDHINGRAHLPEKEKNLFDRQLAMWLKKNNYPEGEIQILCHNCNSAKGNSRDNKCPHEKMRKQHA